MNRYFSSKTLRKRLLECSRQPIYQQQPTLQNCTQTLTPSTQARKKLRSQVPQKRHQRRYRNLGAENFKKRNATKLGELSIAPWLWRKLDRTKVFSPPR